MPAKIILFKTNLLFILTILPLFYTFIFYTPNIFDHLQFMFDLYFNYLFIKYSLITYKNLILSHIFSEPERIFPIYFSNNVWKIIWGINSGNRRRGCFLTYSVVNIGRFQNIVSIYLSKTYNSSSLNGSQKTSLKFMI